jgi:hypothetical protein
MSSATSPGQKSQTAAANSSDPFAADQASAPNQAPAGAQAVPTTPRLSDRNQKQVAMALELIEKNA